MPHQRPIGRTVGLLAVVAMLVVATAGPPVAAQSAQAPAFVVAVNPDGSADIALRLAFDLTTDDEQQAFETLRDDEQARQDARDRYLDRMRTVASDSANATGREMAVTGASIDIERTADGETGLVTITASWSGLAAVEGETLVVTEPFASGFSPDRPFVLRAPEDYEVASASPAPDDRGDSSVTWQAGTSLSGFTVELVPAETADGGSGAATTGQPGFGTLGALVGVLVGAGLLGRSRRRRAP